VSAVYTGSKIVHNILSSEMKTYITST
jgi:hypothetical protein